MTKVQGQIEKEDRLWVFFKKKTRHLNISAEAARWNQAANIPLTGNSLREKDSKLFSRIEITCQSHPQSPSYKPYSDLSVLEPVKLAGEDWCYMAFRPAVPPCIQCPV